MKTSEREVPNSNSVSSLPFVKDSRQLGFLAAVILCLLFGAFIFSQALVEPKRPFPPTAGLLAAASGALLLVGNHWLKAHQSRSIQTDDEESASLPIPQAVSLADLVDMRRFWLILVAILLTAAGLWRIPQLAVDESHVLVFLFWLLAMISFSVGVLKWESPLAKWRSWLVDQRLTLLLVGNLFLLALLLRGWQLGTIPYVLGGDEASQGLEAVKILNGEIRNPFTTGWLGVPTMSFYFNSVTIWLMGQTTLALRLPWIFVGALTAVSTFFLVRRLKGAWVGGITAALLVTYHYHIHFSRLGSNQIADPFFLALALLFLVRALDNRKAVDWLLVGIITGLAFYFYAGARLTPVIVAAVLGYHFVRAPRTFLQQNQRGIIIMTAAFLIVAAPMIQYAVRFPNDFNARLNQVGIIQSGWLEREVELRNSNIFWIMFDQLRRAALLFNYYPDRTVWYGLRTPLLDPVFGMIFLLGLLAGTLRLIGKNADVRVAPMVAWWWGGMMLGGMLTESPPSSQRLITLAVPVCFFIAYTLDELLTMAKAALTAVPERAVWVGMTAVFALISLITYFAEFTPQRIYGGPHAEIATEIAPTLNELSRTHRFFFVGQPIMYWGFATIPYLAPDAEGVDVSPDISADLLEELQDPILGELFIVLPEYDATLVRIREQFPDGTEVRLHSGADTRHLVTLYQLPP